MEVCKQTKDFTVCLFGDTLPKGIHYGKIAGRVYTYDFFRAQEFPGAGLNVRMGDKWVSVYPTGKHANLYKIIMDVVTKYIQKNPPVGDKLEACQFRQARAKERFYRKKALVEKQVRKEHKDYMAIMPTEKRPQASFTPTKDLYGQSRIDGKGYSLDWEYAVHENKENPVPVHGKGRDYGQKGEYLYKPFEMGQSTSGDGEGAYSRSGWEVKKEGLPSEGAALGDEKDPREYQKVGTSKLWKGDNFLGKVQKKEIPCPDTVSRKISREAEASRPMII